MHVNTSPVVGEVWIIGVLNARRVRIVAVGAIGVVFRNAYGRHGETERRDLARFLATAERDDAASDSAAGEVAERWRTKRAPRQARGVRPVRVTPGQRVAAEQAMARGA